MRLAELVAEGYARIDARAALADVAAVAQFDRYQTSAGIADAAALVAERAEAAGLREVTVVRFPAGGAPWWTWAAPPAWTPLRARLSVDGKAVIRYPQEPFTLAAFSAGTGGSRSAPLLRWSRLSAPGAAPPAAGGAVVVLDTAEPLAVALPRLAALGVPAVVADPLSGRSDRIDGQVGRLELPPGAGLAAFSVDAPRLAELSAAADRGAVATVEVTVAGRAVDGSTVDGSGAMPVVTGVLPGRPDGDEVLLTAHLCHPRPSANDNASGVATLLAAARTLAGRPVRAGGCTLRFLWGPEFLGVAAWLHDMAHAGRAPVPVAAINVDMAGQDVNRCGGPLTIERGPDDVPSFLPALAGRCAALLPPAHRSYSGAVPTDPWSWRFTPYAGGSDHAIPAGDPTRAAVVSLGHWPDRFNHSSADTLDTVDGAELRRTAAIVTGIAGALRGAGEPELTGDIAAATGAWAADHVLGCLPGRLPPGSVDRAGGYDPYAPGAAHGWLRHRTAVAEAAVAALRLVGVVAERRAAIRDSVTAVAAAVAAQLPADGGDAPGPDGVPPRADGAALVGRWSGPVNLRALAAAAPPADRAWLDAQLAADRGGTLARLLALLHAVGAGRAPVAPARAAWRAAFAAELPIPSGFVSRAFDLMLRAGWVTMVPPAAVATRGDEGAS